MSINWSDLQLMLQRTAEIEKIQQIMREQYRAVQENDARRLAVEREEMQKKVETETGAEKIRGDNLDDRRPSQGRQDASGKRDQDEDEDGEKHIDLSV